MPIVNQRDSINNSIKTLYQYQNGDKKLIKTNREWLDSPGGVLKQSIILILGASFSGKTTELQNITDDIMNIEVNSDASNFVVCTHSFEMSAFSLTLRDIKKITKQSYKEILSTPTDEKHKEKLSEYFNSKRDGRFYINHQTGSAVDIVNQSEEFLKKHTDKELCLIEIDHLALLRSKQDNKKASIDELIEMFNSLKLKYPNFLLILLTQANRNIYSRIKAKSNEMKLSRNDIYGSDTAFHISDYCYGLVNAYYMGVEEYRKINPNKYPHLEHRFTDVDSKGKVSLYTEGCIFVEVLKDRMVDDLDFTDLFTIEVKEFEKPESTMNITPSFGIETPNFDSDLPQLTPQDNIFDDIASDEDDVPF